MPPRLFKSLSPPQRRLLRIIGLVILVAGYTGALLVWRAADRLSDVSGDDQAPLALLDSRKDSQQLEEMEGKIGLTASRLSHWVGSMLHGKNLARTLIVFSSGAAIGCFIFASRRTS